MSKNLIELTDLSAEDIEQIWRLAADAAALRRNARIAWSFEGNGIRTRTSFIQAFQRLGAEYVELPNLLKTAEPVTDLAGYLDAFYDLYVIRDSNHERLAAFAAASAKPVINAMSAQAHPCEVLTDAAWLQQHSGDVRQLRILLWGPMTNVFRSWHALAAVMDLQLWHQAPADTDWPLDSPVRAAELADGPFDVVITDAWPAGFDQPGFTLQPEQLAALGSPILLPTPPVSVGRELGFSPNRYRNFAGYAQKYWLLPVQQALLVNRLSCADNA